MTTKYNDKIIILEMVRIIDKLNSYVESVSIEKVSIDHIVIEALAFNFQLISILSKRVSNEIRLSESIKWAILDLYGDCLIHKTFGIEYSIMFDIIINDFPEIKKKLSHIIQTL